MAKQKKQEAAQGRLAEFFEVMGNKSESTLSGYRSAIWLYLKFVLGIVDGSKADCPKYVDEYFDGQPDVCSDFKRYLRTQAGKPPLSARQTYNQIKMFLETVTDAPFTPKELKTLKNELPKGGVSTQEADLDTEALRAILQHCDVKGKAVLLCLATGGMRIGELLQVRCKDVDLDALPAKIEIRAAGTKTRSQRYTYISSEAVAAVREWVKVRPAHIAATVIKSKNIGKTVNADDDRLFPFSDTVTNQLFREAVVKVYGENETDSTTGRSMRHVHQLRKFFISQLSLSIPVEVADFFAGHKSALSDNYRRFTAKQTGELYLKGEHNLYVEAPAQLREMGSSTAKKLESIREAGDVNQALINSLILKNEKLSVKYEEMAQEREAQDKKLDELAGTVERLVLVLSKASPELFDEVDADSLPHSVGQRK